MSILDDIDIINRKYQEGVELSDEEKNLLAQKATEAGVGPEPTPRKVDLSPLLDIGASQSEINQLPPEITLAANQPKAKDAALLSTSPVSLPTPKASLTPPAPMPESVAPVAPPTPESSPVSDLMDLRRAQRESRTAAAAANLGEAGVLMASKGRAPLELKPFDEMRKAAGRPVEEIKEQQKFKEDQAALAKKQRDAAKTNPNSPESKTFRKSLEILDYGKKIKNVLGVDFDKISAADKDSIYDIIKLKEQIEMRKMLANQTHEAKLNAMDDKTAKEYRGVREKALQAFQFTRGNVRPDVRIAQQKLNGAERILALQQQFGDYNKIPRQYLEEVALATASLLSPGNASVAAQKTIENLKPSNWKLGAAKVAEWVTSNPVGAEQGGFVKQFFNTAAREAMVAANQVKNARLEKANTFYKSFQDLDKTPGKELSRKELEDLLEQHNMSWSDFERYSDGERLDPVSGEWYKSKKDKSTIEKLVEGKGQVKQESKNLKALDNVTKEKRLVRKQYSPNANKTKFIYEDGSEEIKDGRL